jgi:creatinine amidohydrolase
MGDHKHILSKTAYATVKESAYDIAVLPWGATEAHNLHLAYGTDIFESDHIAAEAGRLAVARGAHLIVLPTVPYGVNTGQLDIKMTINMNPSTQMALLADIADSLERHGIQKLVILNSHGGNDFRQMIRELQPKRKLFLCSINWYKSLDQGLFFDNVDDHAGEMETSIMLHIAPELVLPLDKAGEGKERKNKIAGFREGWAWTPRPWTRVTDDTGVGNPTMATAEKGKKYFEAVTSKVADFFVELASTPPEKMFE